MAKVCPTNDSQIEACVSNIDWMIIPVVGEESKEDAKQSQRPNLYFDLSQRNKMLVGITYDKLDSVKRLRGIISPHNEKYRNSIIESLLHLDDDFSTTVFRKIKDNYWGQSPRYDKVLSQQSNKMSLQGFIRVFQTIDSILSERDTLEKGKKYHLAPAINLVDVKVPSEATSFQKALLQIKPIYEIAVSVKTEAEFEEETEQIEAQTLKKRQKEFAKYVAELKDKLRKGEITPEQYRTQVMYFSKTH